jgi:hypothetical protein
MKTYKIAYEYLLAGQIEVEASSLEEAKELALELSCNNQVICRWFILGE